VAELGCEAARVESGSFLKKGNSQAVQKIKKVSKNKEFFFEKKNQKTFAPRRQGRSKATGRKLLKFFCFFLFTKRSSFFFLLLFKIIFPFLRLGSYEKRAKKLLPRFVPVRHRPVAVYAAESCTSGETPTNR
jgi:hypothetical protein